MVSPTISEKKTQIIETKNRGEEILSEEEVTNLLLDHILEGQKLINEVNDVYLELFPHIDEFSRIDLLEEEDSKDVKEVIDILHSFNTKVSRIFAMFSKSEILSGGCKSHLLDLRINIRNMRESLSSLEELFFLAEEDDDDILEVVSNLPDFD